MGSGRAGCRASLCEARSKNCDSESDVLSNHLNTSYFGHYDDKRNDVFGSRAAREFGGGNGRPAASGSAGAVSRGSSSSICAFRRASSSRV